MQFTIKTKSIANQDWFRWHIINNAKTVILRHKLTPGERKLNDYLKVKCGVNLQAACMHLLMNCKIYKDLSGSMIILFPKKSDDLLASFITYGNNTIKGSNLLKSAFMRDI